MIFVKSQQNNVLTIIIKIEYLSVGKQTFDLTDFHFLKEHSSACKIIL